MKTNVISIIIVVKNDLGLLKTLEGLKKQNKPVTTEVIVIDASDRNIFYKIRKKYTWVRWYQFTSTTQNKSTIYQQRNLGIFKSKGNIIVFIDANCIPIKNWLIKLTKPIIKKVEFITAGSVQSYNPKTLENINPSCLKGKYLTASATINLAFNKTILKKVGKFDETFLYGGDVDFTWRCNDMGYKILFVRDAIVKHDWGDFYDEITRVIRYGVARAHLYNKHKKRIKEIFSVDIVFLIYGSWLIGLPITYIFPWYPLTILLLAIKNRNNKPFKTIFLHLLYTIGLFKGSISIYFSNLKSNINSQII